VEKVRDFISNRPARTWGGNKALDKGRRGRGMGEILFLLERGKIIVTGRTGEGGKTDGKGMRGGVEITVFGD